jgi:acyl carrier protein
MDNIGERVKKITAKSLDIETALVKDTSNFSLDLGADSLDTTELVMNLEDEFDIEISDIEADNIFTVAEVTEYIKERLNG